MRLIVMLAVGLWLLPSSHGAVLPPDTVLKGLTVGEWTAECWRWIFSIPTNQNPQLDRDGRWANHQQPDPDIFFIAPLSGSLATTIRRFTVPPGKYILAPVLA